MDSTVCETAVVLSIQSEITSWSNQWYTGGNSTVDWKVVALRELRVNMEEDGIYTEM